MSVPQDELEQLIADEDDQQLIERQPTFTIDAEVLTNLGVTLSKQFSEFEQTRKDQEEIWLKNYRQYKGVYDPEILKNIPEGFSKAYPKVTRTKVKGLLARMMEMLFPSSERNWSISPSPVPNISKTDLQTILDELQDALEQQYQAQVEAAQQAGPIQPGQELPQPEQPLLDNDTIDKAVMDWAKNRAENMSVEIDDQLQEMDFMQLAKKVIKSGIMYGLGVLRGPMVEQVEKRNWKPAEDGTGFEAETVIELRPFFELVKVWNFFPDFSVDKFEYSDAFFEEHIMSRHDVYELTKRPDFFAKVIEDYLTDHQKGNYKRPDYQQLIRDTAEPSTDHVVSKLYSVKERVGYINGHELKDLGVNVKEADLNREVLADVWLLDNKIIKAKPLPYATPMDFYHLFVFDEEESESSPVGSSLPDDIRDSQLSICAGTRMMLDNASITTGPQFEINIDLLAPGMDTSKIHAFKTWIREGTGADASAPAIRTLKFDSHTAELQSIVQMFREFSDEESMLPKWAIGASQNPGEALRTAGGTSMLLGAANMSVKDIVRQFDKFTKSVLGSLVLWNMLFNPREDIKGDFHVIPRGAQSLVAKEIRANALDQFAVTLSPDDSVFVKRRALLIERMKVRDLPYEDLLYDEKEADQRIAFQQEASAAAAKSAQALEAARTKKLLTAAAAEIGGIAVKGKVSEAQIQEILSRVERNLAAADKDDTNTGIAFTRELADQTTFELESQVNRELGVNPAGPVEIGGRSGQ